jgi:hypothetical protein
MMPIWLASRAFILLLCMLTAALASAISLGFQASQAAAGVP